MIVTNGQKQLTEAEAMGRKPEADPYAEERARIEADKKALRDQAAAREQNIWKGFRGATFKELAALRTGAPLPFVHDPAYTSPLAKGR